MLALRLTRSARPAVQLRRLLVATASAGTGFLLLCTLGHALTHPDTPAASVLRLAWCAVPLASTVYFALAVARTDPGTRPRPGLAAIGLGPARLMAVSAMTTALSTLLGSMLALLVFLHLRGDLRGMPFDGAAGDFLAAGRPLPLPASLTLLALVPVTSSLAVALMLRPRDARVAAQAAPRMFGRFGAYGRTAPSAGFGEYGRFGARWPSTRPSRPAADGDPDGAATSGTRRSPAAGDDAAVPAAPARTADGRPAPASAADGRPGEEVTDRAPGGAPSAPDTGAVSIAPGPAPADGGARAADGSPLLSLTVHPVPAPASPLGDTTGGPAPRTGPPHPTALPWGIALLAAGLAVEAYANRTAHPTTLPLPGGLPTGPAAVLLGWTLTAVGLALAGPGLTHLCGRLLQTARPGALRLLAGRGLMQEASRIGRPLGVVCAVASGAYTMAALYDPDDPSFGPLTTLGALVVVGCTVATLLTAAVEARQVRADTTAALLRLGAPAKTLRSAAALRTGALLALFVPLTLIVAELAALPLMR
ncbi:hypothetical protein [Streptomyces asoensis]|uniref:Integral membrane protein n=1 Tax=Streptomyces asoensis TaxID=249586 RepID=A0ABQ3SAE8_9ACTN|nr:hypothetical protein [Streptomyces asoensis]GGQ87402.1 hypothetical protein GCM10010496_59420 [Streptomyces asoensis]GHI65090.1 hypothetical protein Saso_67400 [Streptomyces asoensis]